MAIDTRKYILADKLTGEVLSDATRVAKELEGARMYDIAADPDEYAIYADTHGVELYSPGMELGEVKLVPVTQFAGTGLVAIDADQGSGHQLSSLVLLPAPDDELSAEEVIKASQAEGVEVPLITARAGTLETLPFEDSDS